MIRRKLLHFAVILSMLLTMVGFVAPAAVGAADVAVFVSPAQGTFLAQQIDTTSPEQAFAITNPIDSGVSVATFSVVIDPTYEEDGEFNLMQGCTGVTLDPGESCTFRVSFDPEGLGAREARVEILFSNYNFGTPLYLYLYGEGITPSVTWNGPNPASPYTLDFGNLQFDDDGDNVSADQVVTFQNTGDGPVLFVTKFFNGGAAGHYRFTNDTCFISVLPAGGTCTLGIAFAPESPGSHDGEANFVILANGLPLDMSVILQGNGLTPSASVSPSQLDFAPQRLFTQSDPQVVTITNTGTDLLTITDNPSLDGLHEDHFRIQNNHCIDGVVLTTTAPGNTCTFEVIFRPLSLGEKIARVEFDIPGPDTAVTLNGTGDSGFLSIDQNALHFGGVQPFPTLIEPKTLKITNTSPYSVQIFDWDLEGPDSNRFEVSNDNCSPSLLLPGEFCTMDVFFRPNALGDFYARLDVEHNGEGGQGSSVQLEIPLTGTGVTPQGVLSTTQLNFDQASIDLYSAPKQVTFTNDGTASLEIPDDLVVTNTDGDLAEEFFIQSNECQQGVILAAGEGCTFEVVFLPSAFGAHTAEISIAALTDFLLTLNGVGAFGTLTFDPNALDFGNQPLNVQSAPRTIEVTNTSPVLVLVDSVIKTGGDVDQFILSNNNCPNSILLQNQTCSVDVSFRPATVGPKASTVQLASANANGSPLDVPVIGNGVEPTAVFDASAVDFGNQMINTTSVAQTVKVTNNGPGNMQIFGVSIEGDNPGDFLLALNNGCSGTLVPMQSCTVQVKFKPTAIGPRSAQLRFDTDAANSPNFVALTGNGTPIPTYTVAVSVSGVGCTASAAPAGPYQADAEVTLTVNYNAATTIFIGWTLDGNFVGFASPLDFTINSSSHNVVATCVAKPSFTDVNGATPYNDAIIQLAARGVIKGFGNGAFGPSDGIVRAQMAAITARLAGWNNLVKPNIFTDRCNGQGCIDDELWNAVAVTAFFQVARGYEDNTFRPFDPVANIQAVAFITRTMVELGLWQYQPDNPAIYPNVLSGTGHRVDISTYYFYAGAVPGTNAANAWAQWDQSANRAYFAGIYWQAYQSYYGTDQTP